MHNKHLSPNPYPLTPKITPNPYSLSPNKKAVIFNIMRYSIHDGPGIRTTVFFKGCPLSCKWCHNPESLLQNPQEVFNKKKCINCAFCKGSANAVDCPSGAREVIGYEITVGGLLDEIKKDTLFYEQSGGGVTFSGGEPFFQADFLLETLKECNKDYIKTAIDTSGYCDAGVLLEAAKYTDWFLYDIKFIDPVKHNEYCGFSNEIILENLKKLSCVKTKILIRIPVIPSINDDLQEMSAVFEYIKPLSNIETVHLLPYHNIHGDKYKRLGMNYELSSVPEKSANIDEIVKLFGCGFKVKVGG